MINRNATIRASFVETDENSENLIQINHNGTTFPISEIKFVMDYVGPTGEPVPMGILREVSNSDIVKISQNDVSIKIQEHELGKILHFVQ
jgi:hypothetical protein